MDTHREKLRATEQEISVLQDNYDAGKRTLDQNLINARFMAEQLVTIESTKRNAEVEFDYKNISIYKFHYQMHIPDRTRKSPYQAIGTRNQCKSLGRTR